MLDSAGAVVTAGVDFRDLHRNFCALCV